jgi:hypothetical protein
MKTNQITKKLFLFFKLTFSLIVLHVILARDILNIYIYISLITLLNVIIAIIIKQLQPIL